MGVHACNDAVTEHSQWFTYGRWISNNGDREFDKNVLNMSLQKTSIQIDSVQPKSDQLEIIKLYQM